MIDLSFLTEAEQEAILKVLQRDAELKKVEEDRIRHLQDAVDEHELKYKSGQWFYEAKSKRHSDKIHGADLVRASIRKRKKPATIEKTKKPHLDLSHAELGRSSKDKAKKSWVNSVNKDIFIPPELVGVLEEPEEVIEDLKLAKVEKSQSARKVSFLAPDKDKHTLMNGSASPIKLRKNPFNSENAGLDVTDIGDVKHTLENGLDLPKPDKMSSKVKFGVKLPYADLNGGSPISLKKTDASLKLSGEPPVPKPRTLLKNDQALDRSSSQAKREDSVNGTGRPRGILKRYSSSSSTDSENIRLAHPIESCRIALPGSPILEVQKESAIADANGSLDSDRFKHVRFSSKVLQKTPPQSPEPFGGNEMNEFRILDQGLSNTQLDPSATDGLPSRNPKAVGLDVPQVNPSVTTSTLSSTSLGSDVDVLDSTLSEKPSLDKNLTLQTNIATGPEHIYAVVKKQPKIPSAVEIPEYMRPSSREPRFIGQEGTPLEFGKSYGGGGKTNYSPSYPVPSPEHLAVLSEEQPKYNFHKKPGDDKEGLNPQSGNFKVLPIKDRIETSEVMSNPSEYQNLKSYWNFDGRSPLAQETKPSPGKLQDTILYRSWQRKDVDHRDSKEPSENNLLPNTFDLSEEEQSSHKVATWLAQSSNLYEPLYTEDPGNASEETEDVSSIPKEEQNCPEDLYEKPVVNSVMLESNPPKTSIHEEPPRQVGFIGFEQMENPGNQHVAEEVIERTAVAKSDNQEFISALQKLEIEASQTEETHEPNASDASSTQSEEEAPSIVEEEITKDAVDTEKNSSDFYNRLLELEAEYKRDPDPEEPEDFATNDIKVSQFPNKEVFISKKVYSSVEFVPSDGILSTDHSGSGSTDMNKERSLLDSYIKSAAKYQSKSPGIYENNMGNGLNYKPEIDIPDVPKPNAVILKQAGSINPILSALKRSEAKAICKPVLDVTPTIPNEDEADKLKEQLEREIPIDTDLQESQFKNPEKLKQLSKSVPAFLHDETDGKDTDSASESSFPIGKHKKSPSSLTDLSGSSGMASMSSVSGSVMSVYSGDFGNVDVKGTIQFAVDYVDQLKEFHVFVSQCKDLAIGDVKKQRSDPYVKSYLYPEKAKMGKRKTAVKKKTLNPAYNEILRYKISKDTLLTQSLNLSVWHNDALGRNSFLGEVELPLDQWDWNNKQMNWYPLQPRTPAAGVGLENRGEIKLSLKYVPQSESGGKSSQTGEVHIWIKDCNQLPQLRGNKINSFVKCTILPDTSRKSRQKTRTVDKTPNPIFNHTMVYDGFKEEDLKEACVELTVWDHNKLTNHFLGGLRIGLGTGKSYGTAVDWMDSTTDESSMWEKMIKNSNVWADGVLPLRMLKMAKITK
uniref:Synaptotagmin-like protein 2 n=1 Tax=Leptobrachium leishanense TaxID=445787 RepID=A0A8C5M133_9ANUR